MQSSYFRRLSGADWLTHPFAWLVMGGVALFTGFFIRWAGAGGGFLILSLPPLTWLIVRMIARPQVALMAALWMAFLLSGLGRYLNLPWGLGVDLFLFLGCIGLLIRNFRDKSGWEPVRNDICLLALIWFLYVLLELFNPESRSFAAWFYAMRGVGFYQLLAFALVFVYFRHPRYLDRFIYTIVFLSVLGALWGLRQQYFGTDAAEDYWLYVENHQDEHLLFGKLRIFSFYSDAGQFGASQAMFALVCGIIFLAPIGWKGRLFFLAAAGLTFTGFMISGTRGALAVPAAGTVVYMVASRNFKILIAGTLVLGMSFYVLKYTYLFHGIEEVRRMRTALAEDNPSLQARLRNQVTFGNYLRSRPFGGGIGSAGFWGARFSPDTILAQTPTDSYYVKIWAETGIAGICLHLFMLGYFLGKGGYIVWHLRHPILRYKILALYSGYGGVLLASYGNQVFSQMPTGMIMNIALPMIFMAPEFDRMLDQEQATTPKRI